ncbi:hypothetical protein Bca4012_096449 [Brassica carinata]
MGIVRGHMVRRQAVATFCCVMGIVKLQALARGREIRRSDIGIERTGQPLESTQQLIPHWSTKKVMAKEKEDVKEERTPRQNNKENNKLVGKKDFTVTATQTTECEESNNGNENSSQGLPSYMQATKSKAESTRLFYT